MSKPPTNESGGPSASLQLQPQPAAPNANGETSPFHVPALLHFMGGLVHRLPELWLALGRLETSLLAHELRQVSVRMPIYVCGLARSGSTLLHEVVSSDPAVATHRMKDYPMVFTPYWWRRATARLAPRAPRERPHQDKVMVTTESPDALEEMIWTAFFPRCHNPSVTSVLGAHDRHPLFEAFYDAHIRKLLLAETATRYAAKANYHVARLAYLVRLFPDAKILIPVRAPASQIVSLMRQHQLFSAGQRKNPRALAFMRRSGHFEFGLDRRPMHLGNGDKVRRVLQAWSNGEEARGLAVYWSMVYDYLARLLESDAKVRAAALVVRFEDVCESPTKTLQAIVAHCMLPNAQRLVEQFAPAIRSHSYYKSPLSQKELATIREETAAAASPWAY